MKLLSRLPNPFARSRIVAAAPTIPTTAPAPADATQVERGAAPSILPMIVPAARDRWQGQAIRQYTPERVEQILRGAALGNLVAQWEMFDLMLATWPRLSKAANELVDAVAALEWNVQPWSVKKQKPSDEAQRRADLVEDLIWSMEPEADADENDFEGTIKSILFDGWFKGIGINEIDWAVTSYNGGHAFAPRATHWIHPRFYGYPATGRDRLMLDTREMASQQIPGGAVLDLPPVQDQFAPFPANKFLIGIAKAKSGHPIGSALLRPLGFWWAASNFTGEWFLNFCQIFGQPLRLAFYDPNATAETIRLVGEMLANMGSAAWGSFPAGTQIEYKEAMKGAGDNPQMALIDFADKQADLIVLRQTLTTDAGDRGTQALGTVHAGIREDVIMAAAGFAARVLNGQLVRPICRLNYGDTEECPWLMPGLKTKTDLGAEATRMKTLLGIPGLRIGKTWFYEHNQIPQPADDEEALEGSAPAVGGFGFGFDSPSPGGEGRDEGEPIRASSRRLLRVSAKDATDRLIDHALEDLTGVQAKWLGGVKPFFVDLYERAQGMTDDEFRVEGEKVILKARSQFPELFHKINIEALAKPLADAMGAGLANGAVKAALKRRAR